MHPLNGYTKCLLFPLGLEFSTTSTTHNVHTKHLPILHTTHQRTQSNTLGLTTIRDPSLCSNFVLFSVAHCCSGISLAKRHWFSLNVMQGCTKKHIKNIFCIKLRRKSYIFAALIPDWLICSHHLGSKFFGLQFLGFLMTSQLYL